MITIAIVNIANPNRTIPKYIQSLSQKMEKFEFVDYTGNTLGKSISRFNECLENKEITVIWFLSGGTRCIEALGFVNWSQFAASKAIFLGGSDATHIFLATPRVKRNQVMYFSNLLDVADKITENYLKILYAKITKKSLELTHNDQQVTLDLHSMCIVGGHSVISSLFLQSVQNIDNRAVYYFWEHHGNNESTEMYIYWLRVLEVTCAKFGISNIIIGNSKIYDPDQLTSSAQYQIAQSVFSSTGFKLYSIDQLLTPIQFW